ncbi:TPA: hypothetical protein DHU97_02930 [Candidatus Saccharibacteria bacterium]|nr:hypothetical protein [Candidatus Saccharibacteria bacterium]
MDRDNAPHFNVYEPKQPEEVREFVVPSEKDLPSGYEFLYQEDRILEPTLDGRTKLDVLLAEHGYAIRLVPVDGGYLVYKFMGLKPVE